MFDQIKVLHNLLRAWHASRQAYPGFRCALPRLRLLFIEAVTQPLLRALGLDAQALQQVVAGEESAVAAEGRRPGF